MAETTVVDVIGKSEEAIRQLQLQKIIAFVEPNSFIYDEKHPDYYKKGKRTLLWFEITRNLNEAFPNNKLNRKIKIHLFTNFQIMIHF